MKLPKLWLPAVGAAAGGTLASLFYALRVEPAWFDVVNLTLTPSNIPPAFDGYRIAHFSDIHMGDGMTRERLLDVVEIINAAKPDLIVFTGDFVTYRAPFDLDDLIVPLRALNAPDGKIAVMGNHDYRAYRKLIRRVIDDSGFIHLDNRVHTIRRGDSCLHIAGVESLLRRRARLDLVLKQLPRDGAAILLAHEPDFANVAAATRRFALQLSGHSHGGQIRVPVLTRFALPSFGQRYVKGLYRSGRMLLYVNRGLGMVGLPMRFNCRPEITLITLAATALEA